MPCFVLVLHSRMGSVASPDDCGLRLDQVSEEEVLILMSVYAQARLRFAINRPGDTIVVDNRRFAHGRMPFNGNRNVAAFMGNVEYLNE